MNLYPLKFKPIFKEKIWGGKKLGDMLGKQVDATAEVGESWELSGVEGSESEVANGTLEGMSLPEVLSKFKGELVGENCYAVNKNEFPLLIKYIDANKDLSVQVHPDDELAKKRHNCHGKTEMWYVMQADPGSSLIVGFNKQITKKEYQETFDKGEIMSILNSEDVEQGDVFYIPAGRVHTIGKGLLIAEIQQTSDVTYRIYDFDRKDAQGNTRELHVDEALDALDYNWYPEYKTAYNEKPGEVNQLVDAEYFTTNKITVQAPKVLDYFERDSFVIYTCVEGQGELDVDGYKLSIKMGEVVLIPAISNQVNILPFGSLSVLETYL